MQLATPVPAAAEVPARDGKRYFHSFYQSFHPASEGRDNVDVRLLAALTTSEAECRRQLQRIEQRECTVICQGFAGVLGRVLPILTVASYLSAEESETARRAVVLYERATMVLQACVYQEMMNRLNIEGFLEPRARMAIQGTEIPEWAAARQRYVARLGGAAREGTIEYQRQQVEQTRIQQLALLHITEAEDRVDIERHQLLYIGALAEIHKKRLRELLPRQANYASSRALVHSPESEALITREATQRLAVTLNERDEIKRLQAMEVLALFQLRSRS